MEQARILIVSDDSEFVNSVVQSWQRVQYLPEFTVSATECTGEFSRSAVMLADGVAALKHLPSGIVLAIVITGDEPLPEAAGGARRVVQIRRGAGWAEHAAALAQEAMLRLEAQAQRVEVEGRLRESWERFTALRHVIAETRHGLGNALTSVLGHSELLLLEPGAELKDDVRAQLETIHAMSLKMHETLRRLSSLDTEMRAAEGRAERDIGREPATAPAI
jgi:signal transduction histidine kinase